MLITLQGNVSNTLTNAIQKQFDDFIFSNIGGKPQMALKYKNIPPMEHEDIPTEIQIKDTNIEPDYTKILNYTKSCQLSLSCTDEIPPFRFQVVYDGYDFLYYPEFKLYERPYLLLDADMSLGVNEIVFLKAGNNEMKNLNYISVGESILFKDYGDKYTIISTGETANTISIYLDRNFDNLYFKNDLIIFNEIKYELQSESNILNDSTDNTFSPFKMKFIQKPFNQKNYIFAPNMGKANDFVLVNDVFDDMVDLQGDDKYASISKNVDIQPSPTIALNNSLIASDLVVQFTSDVNELLDIHSYFTVKSTNGVEIFKVESFIDNLSVNVTRGQLGTIALDHNSGSAQIQFPYNIYFILLPQNKKLDKKYIVYRNIDFVLTWV